MENKSINSVEAFAEEVSRALRDKFENIETEIRKVDKVNGSYLGIVVREEGSSVAPTLYMDAAFAAYASGKASFQDVFDDLCLSLEEAKKDGLEFDLEGLNDYDQVKKNLIVEVISATTNKELLDTVPHMLLEDLAIIYRFIVNAPVGKGTVLVTNTLLDQFGVTSQQLHTDALTYAPLNDPLTMKDLGSFMTRMLGGEVPEGAFDATSNIYIASNISGTYGAGVLVYDDFFEKAVEKMHGSFYIIPSSIHELLLVPENGEIDCEMLTSMVKEVNCTTVHPSERLSDNVYHYDSEEGIFELGENYILRRAKGA